MDALQIMVSQSGTLLSKMFGPSQATSIKEYYEPSENDGKRFMWFIERIGDVAKDIVLVFDIPIVNLIDKISINTIQNRYNVVYDNNYSSVRIKPSINMHCHDIQFICELKKKIDKCPKLVIQYLLIDNPYRIMLQKEPIFLDFEEPINELVIGKTSVSKKITDTPTESGYKITGKHKLYFVGDLNKVKKITLIQNGMTMFCIDGILLHFLCGYGFQRNEKIYLPIYPVNGNSTLVVEHNNCDHYIEQEPTTSLDNRILLFGGGLYEAPINNLEFCADGLILQVIVIPFINGEKVYQDVLQNIKLRYKRNGGIRNATHDWRFISTLSISLYKYYSFTFQDPSAVFFNKFPKHNRMLNAFWLELEWDNVVDNLQLYVGVIKANKLIEQDSLSCLYVI